MLNCFIYFMSFISFYPVYPITECKHRWCLPGFPFKSCSCLPISLSVYVMINFYGKVLIRSIGNVWKYNIITISITLCMPVVHTYEWEYKTRNPFLLSSSVYTAVWRIPNWLIFQPKCIYQLNRGVIKRSNRITEYPNNLP